MTESTPLPTPRPVPRSTLKPHPVGAAKLTLSRSDSVAAEAAAWGRMDDEGNVWLHSGDSERIVGQCAAEGSKKDALAIYVRRYPDLEAQLALIEARVETANPKGSTSVLRAFNKQIVEPSVVDNIEGLRNRSAALASRISELRAEHKAKCEQAKAEARAQCEALVERAEAIVASVNTSINRRDTRAELMEFFEHWKDAQKNSPRINRSTNDALWKRLSHAHKVFEDVRRAFFARLEKECAHVAVAEERLINEAETIAKPADWRETSNETQRLMGKWKAAGRASKHDDNILWKCFMAAREIFLSTHLAHHVAVDQEFADNLTAKLELLVEAEALPPTDDFDVARVVYRDTSERWEVIGMVPRSDYSRVEDRMRQIVDEIRHAEDEQWRRADPGKKQRSTGTVAQLEVLIAELDGGIAVAKEAGGEVKAKELNEARRAQQVWLDQVNSDL